MYWYVLEINVTSLHSDFVTGVCKVLEGIHNDKLSEGLHSICRIHITSLKQVSLKAAKNEVQNPQFVAQHCRATASFVAGC